jgi:hypothetical protein
MWRNIGKLNKFSFMTRLMSDTIFKTNTLHHWQSHVYKKSLIEHTADSRQTL